jgi:hypothetical protein
MKSSTLLKIWFVRLTLGVVVWASASISVVKNPANQKLGSKMITDLEWAWILASNIMILPLAGLIWWYGQKSLVRLLLVEEPTQSPAPTRGNGK